MQTRFTAGASALNIGKAQKRPGKGRAQGKDKAAVARAESRHLLPCLKGSADGVQALMPSALKHKRPVVRAVDRIRQDVGHMMPAHAGGTGHKLGCL